MAKKDQLATLIVSLTPAEKKYFKQYANLRSDDKSYVRLFNCVERDGEFNQVMLCKELNKSAVNLAHEKHYLFDNILKALRNYHDKLPAIEMNNRAGDVAILVHKGLYDMAEQRNKAALKTAGAQGKFETEWALLASGLFLTIKTLSLARSHPQREKLIKQMAQKIDNLNAVTSFEALGLEIEKQFLRITVAVLPNDINALKQTLAHPLLTRRFSHPAFRLQQHILLTMVYRQLRQLDKAQYHARKALHLIEAEPGRCRGDELVYAGIVNGYLSILNDTRSFDEFIPYLEKLKGRYYRSLPFNQGYLDSRFNAYYFVHMTQYYLHHRYSFADKRAGIKKLVAEFEQHSEILQKELNSALWLHLQRGMVLLYFFGLFDDEKALQWTNRILNDKNSRTINQMLSIVKMTAILIHVQLGNYAVLPGLLRSAERHVKKFGKWTVVEKETLAFISAFIKMKNEKEKKAALSALKIKYDEMKASLSDDKTTFARIFYDLWVERNLTLTKF